MYKPRLFLKNVFQGSNSFCNANIPKAIPINKALIVSKLSMYEFERYKHKHLSEKDLQKRFERLGGDYNRIFQAHEFHQKYVTKLFNTLKNMGIDVRVVNRLSYNEESVKWADVIIPAGGDGTFLLAASKVRNNILPVIGFNSDPTRSEGHLCLSKYYSKNMEEAIQRILQGKYEFFMRSRIRVTLAGYLDDIVPTHLHELNNEFDRVPPSELKENGRILPFLALNEVFIGETLSARVSHLHMWVNEQLHGTSFKCSGLCVSTGTGSTSWHLSINRLPIQSVSELLRLIGMDPTQDDYTLASNITKLYNESLLFNPTDRRMAYTVRDLIAGGVWPKPKGIKSRDFATKLKVQSKCVDASLVIDGGVSFAFNDGTMALLGIYPEDTLRTVKFVD